MKHCIVHRKMVEAESKLGNALGLRARRAIDTIEEIMRDEAEVVLIDELFFDVREHFSPGDDVTLYGCFLGMCLQRVYDSLTTYGVHVSYHLEGCI